MNSQINLPENSPRQMEYQVPRQMIIAQAPPLPPLGSRSVHVTCPRCKAIVLTTFEEEASIWTYIFCMLLFIVGLILLLAILRGRF